MFNRKVYSLVFFVIGCVFLGVSIAYGFDPMRALAGCALVYIGR